MRKAEIDALVQAHKGRARPVAFFHILRQPALEADDHSFLLENADSLGVSDLLRWRSRCDEGFTGPVIRQLARRAARDPAYFKHEVLDLPRIELSDVEWKELSDLVRGKVPAPLYEGILARGGPRPERPPPQFFFTPGKLDRTGLDPGGDIDIPPSEETLARGIAGLSMRQIVAARAGGRIAMDDEAFLRLAMERAEDTEDDWSRASLELPELMKEAVLVKARTTPRSAERANMLAWLDAHGVPRTTLFSLALSPLREESFSYGLVAWLSRQLSTRAAWEKYGVAAIASLMGRRAFAEIGQLVTESYAEAAHASEEKARSLLEAIQSAFAQALLGETREAMAKGDGAKAAAALSALACLDPPSRVSRDVHELRSAPGFGPELAELVSVNERLVKHGDGRDASLEGVVAALSAIADAFA